eukprot:GFYU01007723.1.p1 GENE.GFYU01007723.1~~GFYU01007723.1.p1  ORF type:complete len:330 (+),score=96.57 GFYU01007723.1:137-1126(+)
MPSELKLAVVVGGTGFVGSHVVKTLLSRGYTVRVTTRDTTKSTWLTELGNVQLFPFTLDTEAPADGVMDSLLEGAAAAFFSAGTERQDPSTIPFMVHNALALVKGARRNGVNVVVLTSSGGSTNPAGHQNAVPKQEHVHWSDPDAQEANGKFSPAAKTRMELACLAEVGRDKSNQVVNAQAAEGAPRLCIVNPNLILGPQLQPGAISGYSLPMVAGILKGELRKTMPNDSVSNVDVRDLAALHVACAEDPTASGRYFGVNRSFTWEEVLTSFERAYPKYTKPPRFEGEAAIATQFDHSRKESLGVKFRSLDETLKDVVTFMIERGAISA